MFKLITLLDRGGGGGGWVRCNFLCEIKIKKKILHELYKVPIDFLSEAREEQQF